MPKTFDNRYKNNKFIQGYYQPMFPMKYSGPRPIVFRSSWELKIMELFDRCSRCIRWGSERTVIKYLNPCDGQIHQYYIDFQAVFLNKDGKEDKLYIEIKPYSQAIEPVKTPRKQQKTYIKELMLWKQNSAKWKAAAEFATRQGGKFKVMTEKEIFRDKESMDRCKQQLLAERSGATKTSRSR